MKPGAQSLRGVILNNAARSTLRVKVPTSSLLTTPYSRVAILSSRSGLQIGPSSLSPHGTRLTPGSTRPFTSSSYISMPSAHILNINTINESVKNVEYAVRGALAIKAEELRGQLQQGNKDIPFNEIVNCNIGNPQQLKQKPITFFRQVTSLTEYPDLLSEENLPTTSKLFPKDAIARAEQILKEIGSTGAYSHSQGIPLVRKHVAQYISQRDGFDASPDDIFLCNGASPGVQTCLQIMVQNNNVGVMIPIPQYPLYTASLALFNAKPVPYYLSEEKDWGLDPNDLEQALAKAKKDGVDTRGLVIINPGNPTGNLLSEDNMRLVLEFCSKNRIVLMADEVYQTNVYNEKERPWMSFKKGLRQLEKEGKIPTLGKGTSSASHVELISFHSTSKGFVGECGRRGGYFELTNMDKEVKEQIYKIASVSLCPAVQGQIAVDLMVNPPKKGDVSFPLYKKESAGILSTLKHRSEKLASTFNTMPNTSCNTAQGAMYLFPKFEFSEKFHQHAKKQSKGPDDVYAMMLLEKTGICVVPGGGFGQREGTYHIRTTFLAPGEDEFGKAWKEFHEEFVQEWHV